MSQVFKKASLSGHAGYTDVEAPARQHKDFTFSSLFLLNVQKQIKLMKEISRGA